MVYDEPMRNRLAKLNKPKMLLWAVIALVLLIAVLVYSYRAKYYPSTDNAYVGAYVVQIAPQVTGPALKIYVQNFSTVKKNQLLLEIDPVSFVAEYQDAEAKLDLARQNVQALQSTIEAAEALVTLRDSELKLALQNSSRIIQLVKRKQLSLAEGDKSTRDVSVARAALAEATNQWMKAKAQLGQKGTQNAQIREAEAKLTQARLNLGYTKIAAPVNGYIVGLTARTGAVLQRGVTYFSLVDESQWWVDANFKETDLKRVKEGQPVEIEVDIYPGHHFQGVVQSISRGSGAAFSLFPAENATGNWVKVTQRFPVRIYITDPDPRYPLRIGASSTVTVDTRKQ